MFSDCWLQPKILNYIFNCHLCEQSIWKHVDMHIYLFFCFSVCLFGPSFNLDGVSSNSQGGTKDQNRLLFSVGHADDDTDNEYYGVHRDVSWWTLSILMSRCQNEEDDHLCDRLAASGFCEGRFATSHFSLLSVIDQPPSSNSSLTKMLNKLADLCVKTGGSMQRRWRASLIIFRQRQSLLRRWQGGSQTNSSISMFEDGEVEQCNRIYLFLGAGRPVRAIIRTPRRPYLTWWLPMGAWMMP